MRRKAKRVLCAGTKRIAILLFHVHFTNPPERRLESADCRASPDIVLRSFPRVKQDLVWRAIHVWAGTSVRTAAFGDFLLLKECQLILGTHFPVRHLNCCVGPRQEEIVRRLTRGPPGKG